MHLGVELEFSPIIGNSMALSNSSVCSSGTGANRLFVKLLKISEKLGKAQKSGITLKEGIFYLDQSP